MPITPKRTRTRTRGFVPLNSSGIFPLGTHTQQAHLHG
jgi:hypothetical protein